MARQARVLPQVQDRWVRLQVQLKDCFVLTALPVSHQDAYMRHNVGFVARVFLPRLEVMDTSPPSFSFLLATALPPAS